VAGATRCPRTETETLVGEYEYSGAGAMGGGRPLECSG